MRAGGASIYALFPLLNAEKTACAGGTAQTAAIFRHNGAVGEADRFFGVYDLIICYVMNHQVHNKSLVKIGLCFGGTNSKPLPRRISTLQINALLPLTYHVYLLYGYYYTIYFRICQGTEMTNIRVFYMIVLLIWCFLGFTFA